MITRRFGAVGSSRRWSIEYVDDTRRYPVGVPMSNINATKSFTLEERLEFGNFRIHEVRQLKQVSNSKFYEDVKAGLVEIEKNGRASFVRGPVVKKYIGVS